MYYLAENRLYGQYDSTNSRYPLVSLSVNNDGAVTVTDENEGAAALPKGYRVLSISEALAVFDVKASSGYKPYATVTGFNDMLVYLDENTATFAPSAANPSAGSWSNEASSETSVAAISENGGIFTITPVAAGETVISATWTPADTDFKAGGKSMKCTIAKRKIVLGQIRDQRLKINTTKDIVLTSNVGARSSIVYTVLSSDTGICSVSESSGTITLTPAASAPKGSAMISVSATDINGKAEDSEVINFNVWVCETAVTITEIGAQSVTAGAEKEIEVTCSGAAIQEITTSDATHFTAEITGKLKFKLKAKGEAADTATITVYCDKRGYGEDTDAFTATIA